jgi:hypothetical protein
MSYWNFSTLSLSVLFILNCSSEVPPPSKVTVLEPLLQTKEHALEVQKTVDQHADATRKAVDTQERGDTSP